MAWTAPRTWVTGEIVTASVMNTHARDNLLALHDMTIMRRTTAITGTAAFVVVTWEAEDLDELAAWASGAPTRLTAPYTGRFELNVCGTWSGATGTGVQKWRIQRFTSAAALVETWAQNDTTTINERVTVHGIGRMDSGDYLEVAQSVGTSGTAGSVVARAVLVGRG